MSKSIDQDRLPPLIVGEVLFDQFADGRSVLGGAPFNVAWNLQGLGLAPQFVSAVGDDPAGHLVADRMHQWGMNTKGLQTLPSQKTGVVDVTVKDGQPSYEIVFPSAWDFISPPPFADSLEGFSLLYYGSLAMRGDQSRHTIKQLAQDDSIPRFVDINIRKPWFDTAWLPSLITGSKYVKLNDDELSELTQMPITKTEEIEAAVAKIRGQYGGEVYFITCGSKGAYAVTPTETVFAAAPKPPQMVDTVGAGDAFAAATIDGLLRDLPYQNVLDRCVQFAVRICGLQGATSMDRDIYRNV
ncbi:2-dehydro-3-deoxygluconokinase [Planctomycetes bacterium CA13]|uniref:2-dehydro-3-deoxygluconokinase n=1 Tax=Novipirellula herctigrandis TaxID=2527986 RepID=A0A5C5YWU4_9BACT|nr:2-dehydro-3-deoxygluconokinase [Planctomycetes bacterium CA13]